MSETFLGTVLINSNTGDKIFRLNADQVEISVMNLAERLAFYVSGDGRVRIGSKDNPGFLEIFDSSGKVAFYFFTAINPTLIIGAKDNPGALNIVDTSGKSAFSATSSLDGTYTNVGIGANGNAGNLVIHDSNNGDAFLFNGRNASLRIGSDNNAGDIIVHDGDNNRVFHMDGANGMLVIGSTGKSGGISVHDGKKNQVFNFDSEKAVLTIGSMGNEGHIVCRDNNGNESIHMDGGTGDIVLQNADCAEDFDVTSSSVIEPGTVVVIDENGELRESFEAYERTVAGVISGGGEFKPGIRLDRRETGKKRLPVALVGKVYCKVDASFGAVQFGDLLTTSPTPGHAMKVSDPSRAFGAVIGKALQPLESDQGLIPILVALQ